MANKFQNNLVTPIHDWKEENEQEDKSTEMRNLIMPEEAENPTGEGNLTRVRYCRVDQCTI